MRRLAALALALAALGSGCTAGAAGGSPVAPPAARRVLLVSVPGVSWADVHAGHLPTLAGLAGRSAVGDLSARIGRRTASITDAYLTVSAGTRALAPLRERGLALEPDERYAQAPASDVLLRRLGESPSGTGYLAIGAATDTNASSRFGARVGMLGDALDGHGIARAVIANADGTEAGTDDPGYERSAATALMDASGVVPGGTVGRSLLAADADAPYGFRLDAAAVQAAFASAWEGGGRRVVLVEASDLARVATYRDRAAPDQHRRLRAAAMAQSDAMVRELLTRVDPARDAVMIFSPMGGPEAPALGLVLVRAPGAGGGLLRSATTRRDGYVQLADIAPTVLELFGEEPPGDIEGRPFRRAGSDRGAGRIAALAGAVADARFRDRMIPIVSLTFTAVLALLALGAALRSRLGPRLASALRPVALAVPGAVAGTYLAGWPGRVIGTSVAYAAFVIATGAVVSAVAVAAGRRLPDAAPIVSIGSVVAVITVDVATGAHLQLNTVFGYSVAVGGRFAGLGNLAFALLSSATLLLAILVWRTGGRGVVAAPLILGAVVVLDGLPMLGADVGGVLSMVPAFGLAYLLLRGRRVGLRQMIAAGGVAVGSVLVFAFVDLARPAGSRTHLARIAEHVVGLRWNPIADSVTRRWQASLGSAELAGWALLAFVALTAGGYLAVIGLRRRHAIRTPLVNPGAPRAAAVGLPVLAGLGLLANDSSFAVPGTMLIIVVPTLLAVTLHDSAAGRLEEVPR